MLVHFGPAAMCNLPSEIVIAPLPAKKQLWEARDEFEWKTEVERESGVQSVFGLAANGELLKLEEDQREELDFRTSSKSDANWEEWCSGMDGFSGLIMLAASLLV